ncbi:MAG: NAD(P)/FAD-dependent oxidoreductase [Solirubrobacteraceae bacterium]
MAGHQDELDVAVVGAGPAGAAAAIVCASAGLRVALLERSAFPRERPGETLHPGIDAPLRELGVLDRVTDAGFPRHEGVHVSWGGAPRFQAYGGDANGPWRGYQAWRARFDALLVERALELGAVLHERVRAIAPELRDGRVCGVRTATGVVRARYVIDAAGSGHWLARRLALELDERSPMLIVRYGYAAGRCPARDGAPAIMADERGWTWTARVADGLYAWARLDLAGTGAADLPAEFAGLKPHGRKRSADVSWRLVRHAAGSGYALAGDAAAVLDPASSHGVLRALLSGRHAGCLARAVLNGRDEPPLARAYTQFLSGWFAHDVDELRALYARLPSAPEWVRAAGGAASAVAAPPAHEAG